MPILDYTTRVEARRTTLEIQDMLVDAGARGVMLEYDAQKQPIALTFQIELQGQWISFRLPSKWQGVFNSLRNNTKIERKLRTEEHARRVAWRIIKDWTEAQLAMVQAQTAELPEVFLPYAVNPRTSRTLYDEFKSGNYLLNSGLEES
jgi:hypothetical protein